MDVALLRGRHIAVAQDLLDRQIEHPEVVQIASGLDEMRASGATRPCRLDGGTHGPRAGVSSWSQRTPHTRSVSGRSGA
jgi:hypothetical protein